MHGKTGSLYRLGLFAPLAVVFVPLAALLADAVLSTSGDGVQWLQLAVATSRRVMLLLRSLALSLAVAVRLQRRDRWSGPWWLLVALPMAVPAPLVGIGLLSL